MNDEEKTESGRANDLSAAEVPKPCCDHAQTAGPLPESSALYYCPMCPGVGSDLPGDCPKCGMALERNPAVQDSAGSVWTCPMHPEVEEDAPGACPIWGVLLNPMIAGAAMSFSSVSVIANALRLRSYSSQTLRSK